MATFRSGFTLWRMVQAARELTEHAGVQRRIDAVLTIMGGLGGTYGKGRPLVDGLEDVAQEALLHEDLELARRFQRFAAYAGGELFLEVLENYYDEEARQRSEEYMRRMVAMAAERAVAALDVLCEENPAATAADARALFNGIARSTDYLGLGTGEGGIQLSPTYLNRLQEYGHMEMVLRNLPRPASGPQSRIGAHLYGFQGVQASGGGALEFEHRAEDFVNASWSMVDLRDLIYDMLGLLFTELSQHGGMAGDDGAGRAFAAVYKPAVATVFASAGHAHQVMANGASTLLKAAEDFVRQNSEIATSFLNQSPAAPSIGAQPSGPDCNPRASHKAEDLPEVVGETSWTDQYLLDKRFHGQRDKLRKTAAVWNSAAKILEDAYWDSGTAWKTATTNQQGETATAVEDFFKLFVGKTPPPSEVGGEETLMANLPTACRMIANACEAYADHIDTALKRIPEQENLITGDSLLPWDRPRLGGDGHDGGLHELVSGDMRIASLGKIPPAMDSSQARVPMPQPDGGGFLPSLPPFLAPFARVPLLVPVAYRPANGPRVQPIAPPAPPNPRFPPLTVPQQQNFQTWLNSLRAGDVSGGKPAEVAYQLRVAGYPEYEVPIAPGTGKGTTLMVDGFRDSDGMAVEAKYVNNPGKKCYRSLEELRANHQTGKKEFLFDPDRNELQKYAAALKDPRNTEMRGVETVTNNPDSVAYWRVMMAAYGVKGYARYVP